MGVVDVLPQAFRTFVYQIVTSQFTGVSRSETVHRHNALGLVINSVD